MVEFTVDGRLQLRDGALFRADAGGTATVTGIWGYHPDPAQMWQASGDRLPAGLGGLSSDTAAIVTDIDGADAYGQQPRFSAGQMLRANEEYLRIRATDPATTSLQVVRAVNGTTLTLHGANTPLFIYTPPADVEALLIRWAAWLYREPDARAGAVMPATLQREALALRRVVVRT